MVVFPLITGNTGSDRIYDGYHDAALEQIDGRSQILEYIPTVLEGPRGTDVAAHP